MVRRHELTDAEWERSGTHSEAGAYSVDRWLQIYAEHPREHGEQARRVLDALDRLQWNDEPDITWLGEGAA